MTQILRRLGRYDVIGVIGRGGAAVVYVAVQRDLGRRVALKELAPFYAADRSFAERFVEESRLIAAMSHPSIVTVHEYFEEGGSPYIAMEYLERGSLRPFIGRLSMAAIIGVLENVLENVLEGLDHGERLGIAHRDLKPENLLIADDGRVKIADFGVARALGNATPGAVVTATGTIGTPAYMAPEQALGGELTPATDLYSLGIVGWELLAGRAPFDPGDNPAALLYRQVHQAVPPLRTVAREIDDRLAGWLGQMLDKQPKRRFPSAQRAWDTLEDIAIELLGPRWRRTSRLAFEDAQSEHGVREPGPSTPPSSSPRGDRRGDGGCGQSGRTLPPASDRAPESIESASPVATSVRRARRHLRREGPPATMLERRMTHARPSALAAGLLGCAVAAVVVAVALSTQAHNVQDQARGRGQHPAAGGGTYGAVRGDVRRLNGIVQLFIAGKRLSHVEHDYRAAVQNRIGVPQQLNAFEAPSALRPAVTTLTQITTDSLSFNQYMLSGQPGLARAPDNAHNALRGRFGAQFNPYAKQYIGVSYTINDL
jgi:serine/threonine protein kinase